MILFICILETPVVVPSENPCVPSPCGPNSQCRDIRGTSACSCLPNYIGKPPNCRPECVLSAECPSNLACINEKCQDPCIGSCGQHTTCHVLNHNPVCRCEISYTGDPFSSCSIVQQSKIQTHLFSRNSSFLYTHRFPFFFLLLFFLNSTTNRRTKKSM